MTTTHDPVAGMSTETLEAEIVSLARRLATGTYELLVLVGELDERGSWAAWGALSCAAWLADLCDIEVSTARTQVRVARAMRHHPELDAAMQSGDVSYAKARVLVAHLTDTNESALVELATTTPAGRLGTAIAAWSRRNEDPDDIDRRHHEERSVSWRTEPDGMVTITARLSPQAAATITAVVDHHVIANRAPAGASLRQQRADALIAAVTGGGGSTTAEVVIHIRGDQPTLLADGTPISDHAVAGLLDESFISLLVYDSHNHPIDASPRRRSPTRRQRRVVDETHPECAHPGCHARTFLHYDHVHPYAQGGRTTLDNLASRQDVPSVDCGRRLTRRLSHRVRAAQGVLLPVQLTLSWVAEGTIRVRTPCPSYVSGCLTAGNGGGLRRARQEGTHGGAGVVPRDGGAVLGAA
ncbi:MAG: DUF222 domain-containing protein [Acidimicrobiia bacterium]|nr:DUF222 domain-containing protein [Acidimicrobiia bacterium]